MKIYHCLIIEDDSLAIEMMTDYIHRRDDLFLAGVVQERCDIADALSLMEPDIVFLDLVIPPGAPTDFHFGLFPLYVTVVVVSAISTDYFSERLPPNIAYELLKPVSFVDFEQCIDLIIKQLNPLKHEP